MDQILLSDNPWMSKDGKLLVGGQPLSVIALNQDDALQLKNLMQDGLLHVNQNNRELADLLLEKNICRPVHDFTPDEIESISLEIMVLFKVSSGNEASLRCLKMLTGGPSPFKSSQIFIYPESQYVIDRLNSNFFNDHQFNLIRPESKITGSRIGYKYFIVIEKPLEITPFELKALALELQKEQSDLIIPKIIGSAATLNSSHTSTLISHFEEYSPLCQMGNRWSKAPVGKLGEYQGIPLLLGRSELLGEINEITSHDPTAIVDKLLAAASSNGAIAIYEPDILVRELARQDLGRFIKTSFEKGNSILRTQANQPKPANVRFLNFLNLSAPLLAGRIGLISAILSSSLQVAYASQKLASQSQGDMAAINFFLRSHRISMDEIYQTFRQPLTLPIVLLSPFSKTSRKMAMGILIYKTYKISRQADKSEIPAHLLLSCLRDLAISAGIWSTAFKGRNPVTAFPKINSTKWKTGSKYPSLKKERQLPTN